MGTSWAKIIFIKVVKTIFLQVHVHTIPSPNMEYYKEVSLINSRYDVKTCYYKSIYVVVNSHGICHRHTNHAMEKARPPPAVAVALPTACAPCGNNGSTGGAPSELWLKLWNPWVKQWISRVFFDEIWGISCMDLLLPILRQFLCIIYI